LGDYVSDESGAANRGARSIAYSFFQTQKEKPVAKVLTAPGAREYDLGDDPSHPRHLRHIHPVTP
jgi:hypothetical protein